MKKLLAFLVVIGVIAAGVVYAARYTSYGQQMLAGDPPVSFRTVEVKRGTLVPTISATGTIEPEEVVDVGAQVMGPIKEFGVDPSGKRIDYRSVVDKGTVLAQIDPRVYEAQVEQAKAALLRSKADLLNSQVKLKQADQELARANTLRDVRIRGLGDPGTGGEIKAISDSDYDLIETNQKAAAAAVAVTEAVVNQSQAALDMAKTNLDYTTIKSPVKGEIIDRRVNEGQTVVASLNAPSLFLIAKDLSRMQVWASVNEADIGKILSRKDMPVRFTVDAFPGEVFRGTVSQVRLNAQMTQNVVLYTVVITFDNSSKKLLPYLTANVQFEIERRPDVLMVPNGALRWKPRLEQVAPELRDEAAPLLSSRAGREGPPGKEGSGKGKQGAGKRDKGKPEATGDAAASPPSNPSPASAAEAGKTPPGPFPKAGEGKPDGVAAPQSGEAQSKPAARQREERGYLWVQEGNFVRPIEVRIGATDDSMTVVSGKDLSDGTEIVIGENRAQDRGGDDTTNPFAPKVFGRKKS